MRISVAIIKFARSKLGRSEVPAMVEVQGELISAVERVESGAKDPEVKSKFRALLDKLKRNKEQTATAN